MPNTYHPAPDVRRVAQAVIAAHHGHLTTNGVYVKFLYCEEPEKVRGREALGTARKVSGLNAYLALRHDPDAPRAAALFGDSESLEAAGGIAGKLLVEEFFLITIYRDFWRSRETTDHQRRALVDHELCHLWSEEQVDKEGQPTGKILLSIQPHDLEEFDIIASRYGAWRPDITAFTKALFIGQPSLFDGLDVVEEPSTDKDKTKETTVTLTTRSGSVTITGEQLARQASRASGRAD